MKILIAPDSFKEALPALEVCKAIERGLRKANPEIEARLFPLADGGEGTTEVVAWHLKGKMIPLKTVDPLLRPVEAHYFLSACGTTAFIEMAQASGLQLLKPGERNPLKTSTYGVGEMLLDAWRRGAAKIYLAIGGSATNDAGMGMAAALGWRFLSKSQKELLPIGENLQQVNALEPPAPQSLPSQPPQHLVLCDVSNPLFGPTGAAWIYARQKGAGKAAIARLDEGLRHFSKKLEGQFGRDFSQIPGAGAAGGMGAGAMAFLSASLQPGIETLMELTGFEAALKGASLVLTGEGRLDGQTLHGKLIHGICKKASACGVPVVALCGALEASPEEVEAIGLQAAFSVLQKPQSLAEAIRSTKRGLEQLSFNVLKILHL